MVQSDKNDPTVQTYGSKLFLVGAYLGAEDAKICATLMFLNQII